VGQTRCLTVRARPSTPGSRPPGFRFGGAAAPPEQLVTDKLEARVTQIPPYPFWRDANRHPIPPLEGDRKLLVWSTAGWRIYHPDSTVDQWFAVAPVACPDLDGHPVLVQDNTPCGIWRALGALIPGERVPRLCWAWADDDPWTRRSKRDRADEKALHAASTEEIHALVADAPK